MKERFRDDLYLIPTPSLKALGVAYRASPPLAVLSGGSVRQGCVGRLSEGSDGEPTETGDGRAS